MSRTYLPVNGPNAYAPKVLRNAAPSSWLYTGFIKYNFAGAVIQYHFGWVRKTHTHSLHVIMDNLAGVSDEEQSLYPSHTPIWETAVKPWCGGKVTNRLLLMLTIRTELDYLPPALKDKLAARINSQIADVLAEKSA
jgi:hypothetical protein